MKATGDSLYQITCDYHALILPEDPDKINTILDSYLDSQLISYSAYDSALYC